ncbi:hypothetical protein RJO15_19660 [Herbaspirillum huttiense F1]|uniref:hypothetical protein n=1 Tax=Herbaspirillum huttiense TaxID=863372 RepID=UPI00288480A2|nr:hypothetical protein [Herbaspirillum huttiense]MDT0358014.1 hypothetical protein [Herbaspirillum huttiense F1]
MKTENLKTIVGRYLLTVREIAKKAAQGEIVGDLVRTQVKKCLMEMHAAGAEPADIRAIFDDLEDCIHTNFGMLEPKFWQLLMTVKLHVEFLLFSAENHHSEGAVIKRTAQRADVHQD